MIEFIARKKVNSNNKSNGETHSIRYVRQLFMVQCGMKMLPINLLSALNMSFWCKVMQK